MSFERKALNALKWSAIGRLLGQAFSWAITLVILRLLSPADYGLMAIVTVAIATANAIAEFGLGASLVQARELPTAILSRIGGFVILLHVALIVALVLGAPAIAAFYKDPRLVALIQVSSLQFLFAAASAIPQALAARELNFKWLATVELASGFVVGIASLLLAWWGAGVWALVLGALLGAGLRAVLFIVRGPNVWPDFRLTGIGAHLRYGSMMGASQIVWTITNQADALIGGRFLTREGLGVYSVALHLATLPLSKIMSIVNQVAFAAVARMQDEGDLLIARLLQGLRVLGSLGIPLLWGLSAVAPEFVHVVLGGDRWSEAIVPLQLIGLVIPMRMVAMLFSTAVGGLGGAQVVLHTTLAAAVVWPLCFLVGVHWGPTGLAAAWLVGVPLTFALNFPFMSRHVGIGLKQLCSALWVAVFAGALMFGAVALARRALAGLADPVMLVALIGVGAVVYTATLFLLDRRLYGELRSMLGVART